MNNTDPRHTVDFRKEFYPLCDSNPAPEPQANSPVQQRMLEFAAAYYRLNLCYERLRLVRLGSLEETAETILEEIELAVQTRDALEDRLAPEGFYAEPVLDGLTVVNLVFSHALKKQDHSEGVEKLSSFSLFVSLPGPGVDLEEHLRRQLGPLFGIEPPVPATKKARGRLRKVVSPSSPENQKRDKPNGPQEPGLVPVSPPAPRKKSAGRRSSP